MKSQLSNRQEPPNSDSEKISEMQEAITTFAQVYGEHLKDHSKWEQELKDVAIKPGQRLTDIREGQTNFNSQQTEALKTFSERVSDAQAPLVTKKLYLLDAKRWIQWAVWGMLILLVASFFGWNIYLHKINQSLNDYALRYRILRMEHSVNNNSFAQIDSIFETHPPRPKSNK